MHRDLLRPYSLRDWGSSAPVRYYTLSAATEPAAASSDLSVVVGPVSVPDEVDPPQLVVSTGPNQIRVDEFNLWASPLQSSISRVVAQNLVTLLGTPHVTLFPQTVSADAGYRVAIEVKRFDSAPGQAATLDAVWTVRRMMGGRTETGRTTVREAVQENNYEALVAAHSRAVARLSQDIANAVRCWSALHRNGGVTNSDYKRLAHRVEVHLVFVLRGATQRRLAAPSCLSPLTVDEVQSNKAGDQHGHIELPNDPFESSKPVGRSGKRKNVAVAHRRKRHKTEIQEERKLSGTGMG